MRFTPTLFPTQRSQYSSRVSVHVALAHAWCASRVEQWPYVPVRLVSPTCHAQAGALGAQVLVTAALPCLPPSLPPCAIHLVSLLATQEVRVICDGRSSS